MNLKHRSIGDSYAKNWITPPSSFAYTELMLSINKSIYSFELSDFIPCSSMCFSFDVKFSKEHNDYIVVVNDITTGINLQLNINDKYHVFDTIHEVIDFLHVVDIMDEIPKFY